MTPGGVAPTPWHSDIIALGSVLFAIATAVIELGDVVTDVLISIEFLQDNRTALFTAMIGALCAAHAVFVFAGAEIVGEFPSWGSWNRMPRSVRWPLSLIFCPLLPTVNLILEFMDPSGAKPSMGFFRSRGVVVVAANAQEIDDAHNSGNGLSRSALEELERSAMPRAFLRSIASALDENVHRYGLFYVESAVEALPSAMVQLIAMIIDGHVSAVRQVAFIFTLLSISSKLFLVAKAYNFPVIVFKFALAGHDIFSVFYLALTLVAPETTRDASFYGFRVSGIGYVWLWKMIVCVGLALFQGFIAVVYGFANPEHNCVEKASYGMAYLTGLMLSGPLIVSFEFMKLSYGILFMRTDEPPRPLWSPIVLVNSFLEKDDEDHTRLRHLVVSLVDAAEEGQTTPVQPAASLAAPMSVTARQRYLDQQRERERRRAELAEALPEARRRALDMDALFDMWTLRDITNPNWCQDYHLAVFRDGRCDQKVSKVWRGVLTVLVVIAQVISFAYPFVNTGVTGLSHLNAVQAACFLCCVLACVVALLCLPSAMRYWRTNVCLTPMFSAIYPDVTLLVRVIEDYHQPPHLGALQETVPVDVLPVEVSRIAGLYLTASDLGLGELTITECKAINRRLRRRPFESFALPVAEDGGEMVRQSSATTSSFFRRRDTEPFGQSVDEGG